jgi:CDP-glycerol glycerophosphotransferase
MPRISVVVPVYNVEPYLETCLQSLARQTFEDLDVVLVDDGSTDRSADIAREFAARDRRFRLISQANGGLGKARNTGIEASDGEFLAFVDSDDLVPHDAYERLLGTLERTGSDFATGNVRRLVRGEITQAAFLAKTFTGTRLRTHVTRFPSLLTDRVAWNKLWRRSFWDRHGFRFPEGVVHEDIPVVLPAHFLARSVDVLSEPVYVYRIREGGDLSITQRRQTPSVLLDRLAAIEQVRGFLAERGLTEPLRWYDESLLADDLRLHVNVLDAADERYRTLFLERVNALLDDAAPDVGRSLPALERLKWRLVRRRRLAPLVAMLRLRREALRVRSAVGRRLPPPVRARLRAAIGPS